MVFSMLAGRKRTRQLLAGSWSALLALDDNLVRRVALRIVW
jgi:hypothetical protein